MKEKIMYSSLWIQVLLCLSVAIIESHDDKNPLCYYLKTPIIRQINVTVGSLLDGNTTEKCAKSTDSCYILWKEDPKNKSITVISQGCWNDADQKCQQTECIPSQSTKALDNTHFCCCEGNYCNTNITDVKNTSDCCGNDPASQFLGQMSLHPMYIVLIVFSFLMVSALVGFLIWNKYWRQIKPRNPSLDEPLQPLPSPDLDLDTLKVLESVARGRYGSVYRASLNEQSVAVKKFLAQNQQHFLNERAIYLLPHMDHSCLPKYIGSKQQVGENERPEFLLVMSFTPLGCLQDHLRSNTFDWSNLCKMTLSVARGLAHLHSELKKGDKFKPCIVHRDVTSRNILVKMDGTCMLCDFGFAIQISGSTYVLNGTEVKAEEFSLSDVGTLRYMAPEILEGCVNLRDCESALKQADVYALGLVLWEVATRCSDLFQGIDAPTYKLPYEAEIGNEPTMEQMQTLVVKHKSRPLFPDIWKTTNPAVRSLKDTIEDCWDQDAEARLTTLCVEERITELPVLWERDKAGLTVSTGLSPSINPLKKSSSFHKSSSDFSDPLIRERTNSLSDCTTDTLLSPSSDNNQANDKNRLLNDKNSQPGPKITYPLQPHQGRNPCQARNLMTDVVEDTPIVGNCVLFAGPPKPPVSRRILSFSDGDANLYNVPESNLQFGRSAAPIPYVQNAVTYEGKQTNLRREFLVKAAVEKRWNPITRGLRAGWKMLLDRRFSSQVHIPEEQQPLKSSGIVSPASPGEKQGQANPVNTFWANTEAKEEGGCPIDMADGNAVMKSYDHHLLNGHAIHVNGVCPMDKSKRPQTLPVSIENSDEGDVIIDVSDSEPTRDSEDPAPMRRKGSGGRRIRRVKTPFEIKGRLSLYDDRIMSQELPAIIVANEAPQPQLNAAKFSASVPLNMNKLCVSPNSPKTDTQETQPVIANGRPHVFSLCDI